MGVKRKRVIIGLYPYFRQWLRVIFDFRPWRRDVALSASPLDQDWLILHGVCDRTGHPQGALTGRVI